MTKTDIDRGIETVFNNFKKVPYIQKSSDEDTLTLWKIFIAYSYCYVNLDGGGNYADADEFLEQNPKFLNDDATQMIKRAIDECLSVGEKYYVEHIEDDLENFDDSEQAYEEIEDTMRKYIQSVDINKFNILFDIKTKFDNSDQKYKDNYNWLMNQIKNKE